jgi:hypothetical protein
MMKALTTKAISRSRTMSMPEALAATASSRVARSASPEREID